MRRVELTHDVLCGVVRASRDLRHEREAREDTERMLAEQRERAAAARRAMVRARQVAAVCIVLAVGAAVAAAIFAYWSTQRAKRAESVAQQSRVQAETLLGYLTVGFARELENSGRLDMIASLAKREMDYFHGLPDGIAGARDRSARPRRRWCSSPRATRRLGDLEAASDAASEAVTILEGLRKAETKIEGDGRGTRGCTRRSSLDILDTGGARSRCQR